MDQLLDNVRSRINGRSAALGAFDYLVAHASAAGFKLISRTSGRIRSVEFGYPDRPGNPFAAQAAIGHVNFYFRRPVLRDREGLFDAATGRYGDVRPNRLGEYRLRVANPDEAEELLAFLRDHGAWPGHRHASRFTASTLEVVTERHLLSAARRLAAGLDLSPFAPSTDYDVVYDGLRLPPKALFGLAASDALGFPVRPENFRGGEGTQCFRVLRDCGYEIVPKGTEPTEADDLSGEDRAWAEGRFRLVTHLRRERATGLAAAKRASFRAEHGRLLCERCGLDPVEAYGAAAGEACIEVHHDRVHVAEMGEGHQTGLDELLCLCANCHRVVHREMRLGLRATWIGEAPSAL